MIKQQRSKREVPGGYERTDERFKTGRIVTESVTCGTKTERNTNERHRRVNRHSEKREKLLQKELEASSQKVELLTGKMESAKAIFGENSIEANNWSAKLADAKEHRRLSHKNSHRHLQNWKNRETQRHSCLRSS